MCVPEAELEGWTVSFSVVFSLTFPFVPLEQVDGLDEEVSGLCWFCFGLYFFLHLETIN